MRAGVHYSYVAAMADTVAPVHGQSAVNTSRTPTNTTGSLVQSLRVPRYLSLRDVGAAQLVEFCISGCFSLLGWSCFSLAVRGL